MKIELTYKDIKDLISERYGIPKDLIVLQENLEDDVFSIIDLPVDSGHIRFFPNIKE